MIFKERKFHEDDPEDEAVAVPTGSAAAGLEAAAADFLSTLADVDVSQVSLTVADGTIVLSGYVGSGLEVQKAEASLRHRFPERPIENRLRIG